MDTLLIENMGVEKMRTQACQAVMALVDDLVKGKVANQETISALLRLYRDINNMEV